MDINTITTTQITTHKMMVWVGDGVDVHTRIQIPSGINLIYWGSTPRGAFYTLGDTHTVVLVDQTTHHHILDTWILSTGRPVYTPGSINQ